MKNRKKHIINLNEKKSLSDIFGESHIDDNKENKPSFFYGKAKNGKTTKDIKSSDGTQSVQQLNKKLAAEIEANKKRIAESRKNAGSNGTGTPTQKKVVTPEDEKLKAEKAARLSSRKKGKTITNLDDTAIPVSELLRDNVKKQEKLSPIVDDDDDYDDDNKPIIYNSPKLGSFAATLLPVLSDEKINLPDSVLDSINKHNYQRVQNKLRFDEARQKAIANLTKPKVVNVGKLPIVSENKLKRDDLSAALGVDVPEDVNAIKLAEELIDASKNIPDIDPKNFFDIVQVNFNKDKSNKDKSGYYKITTNIKKENIPLIINKIASYVKRNSKGIVKPRVCDLRVIANTNKNQLKNSYLKITSATVVFKPNHRVLKVNKMNRFMISVPENYLTSKHLIVFLQSSRNKNILELSPNDFQTEGHFIEFIGDRIVEFYNEKFDVINKKLVLRNTHNPLFTVISSVLKTGEFNCYIKTVNEANEIESIQFETKGIQNEWLYILVDKEESGKYMVTGYSHVDDSIRIPGKKCELDYLNKNLYAILRNVYAKDWFKGKDSVWKSYGNDEYAAFEYDLGRLRHKKLINAGIEIFETLNLPIKTVSKNETRAELRTMHDSKQNYDMESIVFKNTKAGLTSAILSYLAVEMVGGDPRWGRDYITREEYYSTYHVTDRRPYPERERTVIKKEGRERPYNARIYLFQLEYIFQGKEHTYRAKEWEEVRDATGILTNNIQFPESKY
jgi:hypothetical protein